MSAGCGKTMTTFVARGYSYKEIEVRCGNTSPDGTPWQCPKCQVKNADRDWVAEAEANGEHFYED